MGLRFQFIFNFKEENEANLKEGVEENVYDEYYFLQLSPAFMDPPVIEMRLKLNDKFFFIFCIWNSRNPALTDTNCCFLEIC